MKKYMKTTFEILLLLLLPSLMFAQQFRQDYNYFSVYEPGYPSNSDWEEGYNTFVMNINDNNDLVIYKANGKKELYRRLSSIEVGWTDKGERYQYVTALDGDGIHLTIQYFDDDSIGLRLIYRNIIIQFAN